MSEALNAFAQISKKPEDEMTQKEKNIQQALEQLWSNDNMVYKADLNQKLWLHMARLNVIGKHYDLDVLKNLHNEILEHSVSIKRQGRKEYINLFQAFNKEDESELDKEKKRLGGLLG